MSLASLFDKLKAPFANQRWSWGATRDDGTVFLRVWQDRKKKLDGKLFMLITHRAAYKDNLDSLGFRERLRHVEAVRDGANCYMVMCQATDTEDRPRKIKSYDKRDIFLGGELRDSDDEVWLELLKRVPITSLAK